MKFVLVFDEMEIKNNVIHLDGGFVGYVNYGDLGIPVNRQEATNAFFVYAASISGSTRLPIAYFLTNGSSARLIAEIMKT